MGGILCITTECDYGTPNWRPRKKGTILSRYGSSFFLLLKFYSNSSKWHLNNIITASTATTASTTTIANEIKDFSILFRNDKKKLKSEFRLFQRKILLEWKINKVYGSIGIQEYTYIHSNTQTHKSIHIHTYYYVNKEQCRKRGKKRTILFYHFSQNQFEFIVIDPIQHC